MAKRANPHLVAPPEQRTLVKFHVSLPETLYDQYSEEAISRGLSVEELCAERLTRCRHHNAAAPLYFNDAQRREMEDITGHNLKSPDQAIAQLKTVVALQVGDVGVPLYPQLQARLASRVFRGESFEQVVKREVIRGLEIFAGLLPG